MFCLLLQRCFSFALTRRCTRTLAAAAALTRPQNGKTPLDLIEDSWWDDADSRAAKEATRQLRRS